MDVFWISHDGIERRALDDLPSLLPSEDGFVWVDVPEGAEGKGSLLRDLFGFHARALLSCVERGAVPKVQSYDDHLLLILHFPEPVGAGRTYAFELGLFIAPRYLVTVHELPRESVPPGARRVVAGVREAMESGQSKPESPAELASAIVSALTRRTDSFIAELAGEVAALERRVLGGDNRQPEQTLEAMFLLRHKLLAVRTTAEMDREVTTHGALQAARFLTSEERQYLEEMADRFSRTRSICDAEQAFLQGVIDFYQTRTTVKMNFAMERLALLTAVALPITALASIYGMNLIVNDQTQPVALAVVLILMGAVSAVMLWWSRRQGWW
jgi:magnesium transporter